jgi:argininosuccinate lyase
MTGDDGDGTAVRGERFSGGPARGFLSSLAADERIFVADVAVDRAHVVMLAEQGILTDGQAGEILTALDAVAVAGHGALPEGEDVHEAIESAVIEEVGSVGGRMHTARSRNDEVATCIRYRFREDLLAAVEAVVACREALTGVAAEHGETVMPGYTHLQPAQPTTLAHWALSYEAALARDTGRLLDAYDRTNLSPLGAAAFAGTPFDIDRERTAELLGFDGLLRNATDAVSARDFLLEGVGALAGLATTLSRLAEDLVVYSNKGFLELSDDYASTSSIMPQKKNPDSVELVRACAGDAAGALTGLLTTLKGLPRAYNRDLQRAGPHAWRAVDAVTEATAVAAGAVGSLEPDVEAMAGAAGEGFSTATGVADALAMAGVPFRTAHEAVAAAGRDGTPDADALVAAVADRVGGEVDRAAIERALDPVESVASRDSAGGPAPSAVAEQLSAAEAELESHREARAERVTGLETAHENLSEEVARYA